MIYCLHNRHAEQMGETTHKFLGYAYVDSSDGYMTLNMYGAWVLFEHSDDTFLTYYNLKYGFIPVTITDDEYQELSAKSFIMIDSYRNSEIKLQRIASLKHDK